MSASYHATILYSCACGQDHLLSMESDNLAGVSIAARGVAASLARHSKMVRLTTWWQNKPGRDARLQNGRQSILVGPEGAAHNR